MTLPQNNETQSPQPSFTIIPPSNMTDDNSTSQDQTNNDNNQELG